MPIELTSPRLGWSMEEGVFGEWLKTDGEHVRAGDMVYVLEGEKAAHEIETLDEGILCIPPDAPQPGDAVLVGQVIGFLLTAGEAPPASVRRERVTAPPTAEAPAPSSAASPEAAAAVARGPAPAQRGRRTKVAASPRARRRAQELGVDWTQLRGTGRNGRIRERDVLATADARPSAALPAPRELPPTAPGRRQPVSGIRLTIAQRMLAGVQQTAPVTLTTKVDASALVALRKRWKGSESPGAVPTYNDMLVKLVAVALGDVPELNACWYAGGVYLYDAIHIALAVDTPSGLLAPVIRNADQLGLSQIAERSRTLSEQARAGTLAAEDLQGGTFTITNLGMFDIDSFTPIINLPQAAILGVGRIVQEPVVREGRIEVGETMALSLTFDHRVIDGAPAARWLQRLNGLIRSPQTVLGTHGVDCRP